MRLIVAYERLVARGGTETYTLTVADHLQRLGHDVTLYAHEVAALGAEAEELGLRVVAGPLPPPGGCDAIVTQDRVLAYELAHSHPRVPQAFVSHSELDYQLPPVLEGVVGAVVVPHDRLRRRVEAMPLDVPVVRLRQPVDLQRFAPRRSPSPRPRRALLAGNYLRGPRRDLLVEALEAEGIEWTAIGRHGEGERDRLQDAMDAADLVAGKARVIVEAMACGRPAYVYDWNGCDGWVTPERYPVLEADNFGGQAEATGAGLERVRADLASYDPAMGLANRDLAVANHSAMQHAERLAGALAALAPRPAAPAGPLREMARLARANRRLELGDAGRVTELQRLHARIAALEREVEDVEEQRDDARELWRAVEGFRASRRYRLAQAIAAPADLFRRRPRR